MLAKRIFANKYLLVLTIFVRPSGHLLAERIFANKYLLVLTIFVRPSESPYGLRS